MPKKNAPPIEEEDEEDQDEKQEELYQLIEEALHAPDPDDRAYALNELGLWDATPEVLAACLEALDTLRSRSARRPFWRWSCLRILQ